MNSPIELRGSQAMINELVKNKVKPAAIVKWLLIVLILGCVIHFPDVIAHGIIWIIHIFYEATSYVLEHFLMHTFGLDKPFAQLIVFYFSVITGVGTTVLFWRYYLRDYLLLKFYEYKHQTLYYWYSKQTTEKLKLIIFHSVIMISAFIFLLS